MSSKKVQYNEKSFGERLKCLRLGKKLKQYQVADSTGILKSTLSELENDKHSPAAGALILLSEFFDVPSNWLLTGKDPPITEVGNAYSKIDNALAEEIHEILNAGSPYAEMLKSQIIGTYNMMKTQKELNKLKKKTKKGSNCA